MVKNIRMLDEIEEWCSTELTGEYVLNYAATPFRKEWNMPYQIVFENATDAILFKLRWL